MKMLFKFVFKYANKICFASSKQSIFFSKIDGSFVRDIFALGDFVKKNAFCIFLKKKKTNQTVDDVNI